MDDCSSVAANAVRAIAAVMDWTSSPDTRKAAVSYLESIKDGDVRVLAGMSFVLVQKDQSSEIRMHGFKLLQHLVRSRWSELNEVERQKIANAAINLITEMVNLHQEWALKSQAAALVAEVVRSEELKLWPELLPSLSSLAAQGPVEGELVAMVLRWLPEDITVHNEDLEGDRRRELLHRLTLSLPEIFPLLYVLLARHFDAALGDASKQNFDAAKVHAATVIAVLNAINSYAEWAPVSVIARCGLIKGCGFLLSSFEFRLHASEFFKLLCQRKRPIDESATEFDSAMESIFQILINVSINFLQRSRTNPAEIEESEFEFVECVCESMLHLGASNLQHVPKEGNVLPLYIEQMLGYFQHFRLSIHFHSLQFWLSLMREISSKPKVTTKNSDENFDVANSVSDLGNAHNGKRAMTGLVNENVCCALLDIAFQRLLKKPLLPSSSFPPGKLELWSDDFDGKSDFSQYRYKLLELIRFVTIHKPSVAVVKLCRNIDSVIKGSQNSTSAQVLPLLESMHLGLETVISATFDGHLELGNSSQEVKLEVSRILEGLLHLLLSLDWTEPTFVVLLGRYLDAYGPFLKHFPDSVGAVINKLFKLLTSLPCVLKDPSAGNARHARLQLCTSFIRIAKTADRSLLPHMRVIADTMNFLEADGLLLRGERNLLSEAILLLGSSAGFQQHQDVLAWFLEPLSRQWTQIEWQNTFLSDSLGLARLCSDMQFMWSIFHTVTFFEKALKTSGVKKSVGTPVNASGVQNSASSLANPMTLHISWMLPPLLKLLRCIHSLWSHQVALTLPLELKAAMSMSNVEQASLLGEGVSKMSKSRASDDSHNDTSADELAESTENILRNWLKGIRDSGYNVLGMSATLGDCFFRGLDSADVVVALMENIQSMEFRHIRQLVHLAVLPLVKFCPQDLWTMWIEKLLYPLLTHCQQTLSCSWSNLFHEGRAKVQAMFGNLAGLELKLEVMEEKLLRDLTREVCSLLSLAASPPLNNGLPSLDHLGSARIEISSLKNLDAFASSSLTCLLLVHKQLALPVLQITLQTFTWTDKEAVSKIASFCSVVILLAISSNNVELCEFVAKDLFYAIIQSLTLESNATISSELVGLCREIFFYLSSRNPAPRQVLLSIPGINPKEIASFEDALGSTSSPKDQRLAMKTFLLSATGNKFRSLAGQKTTNVITNVSMRHRGLPSVPENNVGDDEAVGLAAIT